MELRFRSITLTSLRNDQFSDLYLCRSQPDFCMHCSRHRSNVSYRDFENELIGDFREDRIAQWMGYHEQIVVGTSWLYVRRRANIPFVSCYELPGFRNSIVGGQFLVATCAAIKALGYQRVLIQVYEDNAPIVASIGRRKYISQAFRVWRKDWSVIEYLCELCDFNFNYMENA